MFQVLLSLSARSTPCFQQGLTGVSPCFQSIHWPNILLSFRRIHVFKLVYFSHFISAFLNLFSERWAKLSVLLGRSPHGEGQVRMNLRWCSIGHLPQGMTIKIFRSNHQIPCLMKDLFNQGFKTTGFLKSVGVSNPWFNTPLLHSYNKAVTSFTNTSLNCNIL